MSDDPPRSSGYKYGGFESGLRDADGKEKPAYNGFRLPLAVEGYGNEDVLWGLVRPQRAAGKVTIERRITGYKTWRTLKTIDTTSSGVYALKTPRKKGQHYRVEVDRARRHHLHRSVGQVVLGSRPGAPESGSARYLSHEEAVEPMERSGSAGQRRGRGSDRAGRGHVPVRRR